MKEIPFPTQFNKLIAHLLDPLLGPENPPQKRNSKTKPLDHAHHERNERKDFFYYTQVFDSETRKLVGHLSDISSGGFKMDSQNPMNVGMEFHLLMYLSHEVAEKPFMVFTARSRWCKIDPIDPYVYNIGFQLLQIAPEDLEIFQRMMEQYGRDPGSGSNYLANSNKW